MYRIFLSRNLGAEGLGLYQIALSVLGLFMTVTSSGIPVTVSRMMIKYKAEGKKERSDSTVSAGILLSVFLCVPLIFLVYSKSPLLSFLFSDDRCILLLSIMIPGLIFTSVYAVIRGTFWGNQQFLSYSVIEFLEESVMLIAGIILVNKSVDMIDGTKKASIAVLISYLFSFTVSVAVFIIKGGKLKSPKKELKPLIGSSSPITAMRTSTSLINTLVAILLPARLIFYGFSSQDAISLFGKVFGMAFPLIFTPSTLIGSLALVLVPELSENYYSKKYNTLKLNIEKALYFATLIACVIIPAFISAGKEIGEFIYRDQSVGVYIVKGSIVMLPMSIAMITTSMLNSLNKEKRTLLSFFAGAFAMILCIYFLPKFLGVDALTVGMFINYLITAIINTVMLYKSCPKKISFINYLSVCALTVLPTTLFGIFLRNILSKFLPTSLVAILTAGSATVFSVVLLFVLGKLDFIFNGKLNIQIFKKGNFTDKRYEYKQ